MSEKRLRDFSQSDIERLIADNRRLQTESTDRGRNVLVLSVACVLSAMVGFAVRGLL